MLLDKLNDDLKQRHHLKGWDDKAIIPFGILGKGTYGTVTQVYDLLNVKIYAKKVIHAKESTYRFDNMALNEIKPLLEIVKLNDDRLLKIYHLDFEPGTYCAIYMELGVNLLDLLKGHKYDCAAPFDLKDKIVEDLYNQIKVLHGYKLCHRDIKPANLIVTRDMKVKLADFGTAEIFETPGKQLLRVMGTEDYLHPDLKKALDNEESSAMVDPYEADIHSAKITLDRILTYFENIKDWLNSDSQKVCLPSWVVFMTLEDPRAHFLLFDLAFTSDKEYMRVAFWGIMARLMDRDKFFNDINHLTPKMVSEIKFNEALEAFVKLDYDEKIESNRFSMIEIVHLSGQLALAEGDEIAIKAFERCAEWEKSKPKPRRLVLAKFYFLLTLAKLKKAFPGVDVKEMLDSWRGESPGEKELKFEKIEGEAFETLNTESKEFVILAQNILELDREDKLSARHTLAILKIILFVIRQEKNSDLESKYSDLLGKNI